MKKIVIKTYQDFRDFNAELRKQSRCRNISSLEGGFYPKPIEIVSVKLEENLVEFRVMDGSFTHAKEDIDNLVLHIVAWQHYYIKNISRLSAYDFSQIFYKMDPEGFLIELNKQLDNLTLLGYDTIKWGKFVLSKDADNRWVLVKYEDTSESSIKVPDFIEVIGDNTFEDALDLIKITLPEGLKRIGNRAFFYCTALSSIELPSTLETIGTRALAACYTLETIKIPSRVSKIPSKAFINTDRMKSVYLGESVKEIESGAFKGCAELTTLTLPSNVRIKEEAFRDTKLEHLNIYNGNIIKILSNSIPETPLSKAIVNGDGYKSLGDDVDGYLTVLQVK